MLWLALTVLAAAAGALVAFPFLRMRKESEAPTTPLEIYKSQLDDLVRDEAAGELDAAAATQMRTEIERRILETPDLVAPTAIAVAKFDRVTAAAVVAIVVLGSTMLYAATGGPGAGSRSTDPGANANAQAQNLADIDASIDRLRTRLEQAPDDIKGWGMLGWSYFETGRYSQSVDAYRRAVALAPTRPEYRSALAEALTWAGGGDVTPEARAEFRDVLTRVPRDERARYYLALAKAQGGDIPGAVEDWIAALNEAPGDSTWAPVMRADAEAAARDAGIDIAGRLPPAPAASSSETPPHPIASVASEAAPGEQQGAIAGMVDGLEQRLARSPRDAEGWVLLMRSRMVMDQPDRASAALARALEVFEGDRPTQTRLREAAVELQVPGAKP